MITCSPVGDMALSVTFGQVIDPTINQNISSFVKALQAKQLRGIDEIVPTYTSVLIQYDPMIYLYSELVTIVTELANSLSSTEEVKEKHVIEIPTLYGGDYGPDLAFVAQHAGLTEEEVIEIHAGTEYLVYMLGFLPGFAYLGGMDERIATPRLSAPRVNIEAGSVGIAGSQTGMYPSNSPGGWQIIGRTPISLYSNEQGALLKSGDYVRYVPITEDEFHRLAQEV